MVTHPETLAANDSIAASGPARATVAGAPLSADELRRAHAFWRACDYLAPGMVYLQGNPLLKEPLKPERIKNRLLGHWGASPALSFAYTHLSRAIKKSGLDAIFMAGPQAMARRACWGRSIWKAATPMSTPARAWARKACWPFFKRFFFPGGTGSHRTPETPGSIHEGGELGYALSHACGEAETGPLATSWHVSEYLNPARDGAVPPILNLQRLQDRQPDAPGPHQPRGVVGRRHRGLGFRLGRGTVRRRHRVGQGGYGSLHLASEEALGKSRPVPAQAPPNFQSLGE